MIRILPYSGMMYMTFEAYHTKIANLTNEGKKNVATRFVAGSCAGTSATLMVYPLDLMRARMAAHWGKDPKYRSYITGVKVIVGESGFQGLYKGLSPSLLGIVPYAGISFSIYHTFKAKMVAHLGLKSSKELPVYYTLPGGAVAGYIGQSLTYPIDMVRRRMQVHPHDYPTIRASVTRIVTLEGWRALYRGLAMNWIKGPIAHAISFTVNDYIRGQLSRRKSR